VGQWQSNRKSTESLGKLNDLHRLHKLQREEGAGCVKRTEEGSNGEEDANRTERTGTQRRAKIGGKWQKDDWQKKWDADGACWVFRGARFPSIEPQPISITVVQTGYKETFMNKALLLFSVVTMSISLTARAEPELKGTPL